MKIDKDKNLIAEQNRVYKKNKIGSLILFILSAILLLPGVGYLLLNIFLVCVIACSPDNFFMSVFLGISVSFILMTPSFLIFLWAKKIQSRILKPEEEKSSMRKFLSKYALTIDRYMILLILFSLLLAGIGYILQSQWDYNNLLSNFIGNISVNSTILLYFIAGLVFLGARVILTLILCLIRQVSFIIFVKEIGRVLLEQIFIVLIYSIFLILTLQIYTQW